jgi:hypothetical protein
MKFFSRKIIFKKNFPPDENFPPKNVLRVPFEFRLGQIDRMALRLLYLGKCAVKNSGAKER